MFLKHWHLLTVLIFCEVTQFYQGRGNCDSNYKNICQNSKTENSDRVKIHFRNEHGVIMTKCFSRTVDSRAAVANFSTVYICEKQEGRIACPDGYTLNITDAFYGRDDRTTCPGPIRSITCRSETSVTLIREDCSGKQACNLKADHSRFGDPCGGTLKYVKVVYSCVV